MRDVDELIRDLDTELRPPDAAPAWPVERSRRRLGWAAGGLALAAAALLAVGVSAWRDRGAPGARGVTADPSVALDLRMVVERGGVAVRVGPGVAASVGERVMFRVASDKPARAWLWVDGPSGRESIAAVDVDATPRDVGTAAGLSAYRFDHPGTYVFKLSAGGLGRCEDCPTMPIRVASGEP